MQSSPAGAGRAGDGTPPEFQLFSDLPQGPCALIACMLSPNDVLALTHCNKRLHQQSPAIWHDKLNSLPSFVPRPPPTADLHECIRSFCEGYRLSLGLPASKMVVTWSGNPVYWKKDVPEPSSPFGSAYSLASVCWLDVYGTVHVRGCFLFKCHAQSKGWFMPSSWREENTAFFFG